MKIILFIFLTISLTSRAQSFEELLAKATTAYTEKNYLESAQSYNLAFLKGEGNSSNYYNAACSWALTGDTILSIKYLKFAAARGWNNVKHLKSDSDLTNLHTVLAWEDVVEMVQRNTDEYEKDFNKPLKAQLERISVKDQMLRQLYEEAQNKFGKESEEMAYFWELMATQDSINEREVIAIIEKHGWVGTSVVGGQANMTLWLVIQHAPIETQEKYLPMLKASVIKGESSGSHLALLEDRIQMRNGMPQTYGSQITSDENGKQVVYQIKDPQFVNQRRAEVGLGPIEDYVKRWGIVWTIEQTIK